MILDVNTLSQIFLLIIAVLLIWIAWLEIRLSKVFRGKKAGSLENVLVDMGKFLDELEKARELMDKEIKGIDQRVRRSIQGVETVRFNPFSDSGGNQSFATALLDEEGNGVVISSLYSRDKVSVYSKPVRNYQSEFQLTREEKESINKAKR